MTRALLALGSNLGDRVRYLQDAVALLPDVEAVSPVYETDPVGGPDDQRPYLNLVVRLDTRLDAHEMLELCHRLEEKASRRRIVRWGPRTLDVDVLWMDGQTPDHERRAEDQNAGLTEGFAEELEDAAREDQAGNPGAEAEDLADRVEPAPRDRQPARVHLITCSSGWVANSVCVNT